MGNDVFANGMEVSCKAADGKSIACFPDVCFTPPQTPATPPGVPIPYPNTAFAKDTTKGSRTVKISRKEVMLRNKSYFKTSTGDEAGCAPKKGVMTSKIKGKAYFIKWSMDVKFEGQNVVRHLDMTTHNHGSNSNTGPWPCVDTNAMSPSHPCYSSVQAEQAACSNANPPGAQPRMVANSQGQSVQKGNNCTQACAQARACALPKKKDDKSVCCHPDTTGDHLVEVNCFTQPGGRSGAGLPSEAVLNSLGNVSVSMAVPKSRPRRLVEFQDYDDEEAPTACVMPPGSGTNHNRMQDRRDTIKRRHRRILGRQPLDVWGDDGESFWTYEQAADAGVSSHQSEFPQCDPACTRAQLDAYHHEVVPGDSPTAKNKTPVRTYIPGR